MSETPAIRVAVVGLGMVARHVHLPLLKKLRRRFTLTAVCDSLPGYAADVAEQYGLPASAAFTDAEAMFARGGVDAVLLLTSGSHAALAMSAVQHGYAVFCEKPLAHTLGEAQELAEAESGFRRPRLMVGYMKQYDPAVACAVQLLDEAGGPEAIRSIDVTVLHPPEQFPASADPDWPLPPRIAEPQHHRGDRARWEYRALLDSICHDLALIRQLGGVDGADVDTASSWGAEKSDPGSLHIAGPLRNGRYSVRWHYLPHYPRYREQLTVHHREGSLDLEFANPYRYVIPTTLTEHGIDQRTRILTADVSGFERELEEFHLMATEGRRPMSGIAEATADIRTAVAVLRRLEKNPDQEG